MEPEAFSEDEMLPETRGSWRMEMDLGRDVRGIVCVEVGEGRDGRWKW
jgi:hypothetical protein